MTRVIDARQLNDYGPLRVTPSSTGVPSTPRPATSADLAKRAGVSRATVSYILNGKPGVSFTAETREAVLSAARELSYQPNAAARSLVSGTGPIVIVMSHLPQNETTATVVGMLVSAFSARGLLATILQVSSDLDDTVAAILALHPSAALLAFPAGGELGRRLTEAGVVVTGFVGDGGALSLGRAQVGYLSGRGHTRLAFADVVGSGEFGVLPRRAEVIAACAEAGLPAPPAAEVARDGVGAAEVVAAWHAQGVTAVCAYNDEVALAVLYGIREAGLRCPDDLAVIGCDDIPAAAVAYPPLTSVGFGADQDGSWIVGVVLHQLGIIPTPPADPSIPMIGITRRTSA